MKDDVQEIMNMVERIRMVLRGHSPDIQSAVIADLVSMFLAGHVVIDDRKIDHENTNTVRMEALRNITELAIKLIPTNEHAIIGRFTERPDAGESKPDASSS